MGAAARSGRQSCWYRRRVELPDHAPGERWLLHFGAVDHKATAWINGLYAGEHEGGYTPFTFDVTDFVTAGVCEVVLRAEDDPHDLAKPRGKQDWQLEPHSIWYPRTTGIWQTVWMERVNPTRLRYVRWTPVVERWEIGFETRLEGARRESQRLAFLDRDHVAMQIGRDLVREICDVLANNFLHRTLIAGGAGGFEDLFEKVGGG